MTKLPVTPATASFPGSVYVILSIAVSAQRSTTKIGPGAAIETGAALGAEEKPSRLSVAVRRHGHFAEYVPMSLILLALLEPNGASQNTPIGLAVALVVARLMISAGIGLAAPNVLHVGGNVPQVLMLAASAVH